MKRLLVITILGCFTGAMAGCSASATIDPDRDHVSGSHMSSDTSVKKTTYRDANGNVVEQKVERHDNP